MNDHDDKEVDEEGFVTIFDSLHQQETDATDTVNEAYMNGKLSSTNGKRTCRKWPECNVD